MVSPQGNYIFFPVPSPRRTRALTLGMELHFPGKYDASRPRESFLLRWAFVWNDPDLICLETRASAWQHTHESDARCYIARFGMSCLHWHHKVMNAPSVFNEFRSAQLKHPQFIESSQVVTATRETDAPRSESRFEMHETLARAFCRKCPKYCRRSLFVVSCAFPLIYCRCFGGSARP